MFRTICSSVDKLDKSPWDEVKKEMVEEKHLEPEKADKIGEYVKRSGGQDLIDELLASDLGQKSKSAKAGLEDMKLFLKYSDLFGCNDVVSFDLSLARGLDYYTGIIYEAVLTDDNTDDKGEEIRVGSVAGGGRYDKLVGMFSGQKGSKGDVPCVGVSIGIERLFSIMESNIAKSKALVRQIETEVFVASAQKNLMEERMKLCADLWDGGIKAEQSYKKNPKMLTQLQYCEAESIPFALIVGESELQQGIVKLRTIATREEVDIARENVISEIKSRLNIIDTYQPSKAKEPSPTKETLPSPPEETSNAAAGNQLNEEITTQGLKVRDLKSNKAEKADITAAVAVLLDLKAKYKAAVGKDWKPDSQ